MTPSCLLLHFATVKVSRELKNSKVWKNWPHFQLAGLLQEKKKKKDNFALKIR